MPVLVDFLQRSRVTTMAYCFHRGFAGLSVC